MGQNALGILPPILQSFQGEIAQIVKLGYASEGEDGAEVIVSS